METYADDHIFQGERRSLFGRHKETFLRRWCEAMFTQKRLSIQQICRMENNTQLTCFQYADFHVTLLSHIDCFQALLIIYHS